MTGLRDRPWWTAADQAELDLLVVELVDRFYDHLERGCAARTCPHLPEAVEAVVLWLRRRELASRAVYERARQDLRDWSTAA